MVLAQPTRSAGRVCAVVTCHCAPTAAFCAKAIPCFCRGRSMRGEDKVNPCTDLPPRADRNPCFCRGEAELSKTRSQGFCLAPTPRHAAWCPAPTPRPRRSVPWQYPFFVGAGLRAERARSTHAQTCPYAPTTATCHCERSRSDPRSNLVFFKRGIATPPAGARNDKRAGTSPAPTADRGVLCQSNPLCFVGARLNSPRHDPKGSASPLHPGMQRGTLPPRADRNPLPLEFGNKIG